MKKMNFWNYASKFLALSFVGSMLFITSCKEDEPTPAKDAVASFTYTISETNYLEVSFTNNSQNAATWAWNFGDGTTSDLETPTHTYTATGDYSVSLVVKNADGKESNTFTESITITDPNEALKLLTGEVSKEWKLMRDGLALGLGPDATAPSSYFSMSNDEGKRPCLFEQTFTFGFDGSFVFDDKNIFWGENDPFTTTAVHETCFVPSATTMINKDGADVSAWGSGSHTFTYDPATGVVTLNGTGAWLGFVHIIGNDEYSNVPTASRTFNVDIVEETGYDVMTVIYEYADLYWFARYVHYYDASLEPAIVTGPPVCEPVAAISPTEISHTFASNDAAEWVLLQPVESGSVLDLGVDDPADATAAKVGKYTRVEGNDYQELKFQLDPLNSINFENLTTMTMDVYMPSSNAYDAATLTDNVFLGVGPNACVNWYENQFEYQAKAVAKDTWVSLSFDLSAADYVAKPDDGATPKDRNDLDLIYISIGGGGHKVGGTFYIRNFKIN